MKPSLNQDTQILHMRKKIQSYCIREIKYICHNIHYKIPLKQGVFNIFYIQLCLGFCVYIQEIYHWLHKILYFLQNKTKSKNKNQTKSLCFQLGQAIN